MKRSTPDFDKLNIKRAQKKPLYQRIMALMLKSKLKTNHFLLLYFDD